MQKAVVLIALLCVFSSAQSPSEFEHGSVGENDFEMSAQSFEEEFSQEKDFDPLEGYNRVMTGFNDKFYTYVLIPTADGYKAVVPKQLRDSIKNFVHHVLYPVRLINNILQLDAQGAVVETGRFMVNTIFGVGGLFDAASAEGLKKYDEDFGQTLGHYGVGGGFHIVVPFLGPSNLRDLPSSFIDGLASPLNHNSHVDYTIPQNTEEAIYLRLGTTINAFSYKTDEYELMKKNSIDQYQFMKDMYEKRRERQIKE